MTGKAKTLDDLLKLKGVVAAGEFTLDGKLGKYKTNKGYDLSEEQAGLTAQFSATITQVFNTVAGAYEKIKGESWTPQQGWAYSGGDYSVAVGGNRGVFVKTAEADYNQLFEALVGPR